MKLPKYGRERRNNVKRNIKKNIAPIRNDIFTVFLLSAVFYHQQVINLASVSV